MNKEKKIASEKAASSLLVFSENVFAKTRGYFRVPPRTFTVAKMKPVMVIAGEEASKSVIWYFS